MSNHTDRTSFDARQVLENMGLQLAQHAKIVRDFCFVVVGFVFIYLSAFLYEDEEGRIQNALELAWTRLHDESKISIRTHVQMMRMASLLANLALHRAIGCKLVSFRTCLISCLVSVSSLGAYGAFRGAITQWPGLLLFGVPTGCALGLLLMVFVRSDRAYRDPKWQLSAVAVGLSLFPMLLFASTFAWLDFLEDPSAMHFIFDIFFSFFFLPHALLSLVCDLLFIATMTRTLRWCSDLKSLQSILAVFCINVFLGWALVWVPLNMPAWIPSWTTILVNRTPDDDLIAHQVRLDEESERLDELARNGMAIGVLNLVDGVLSLSFAAAAALMALHKIVWPTLLRALYSLQNIGIVRRKKLLATVGIALLTFGGITLPPDLREVIALLSGR